MAWEIYQVSEFLLQIRGLLFNSQSPLVAKWHPQKRQPCHRRQGLQYLLPKFHWQKLRERTSTAMRSKSLDSRCSMAARPSAIKMGISYKPLHSRREKMKQNQVGCNPTDGGSVRTLLLTFSYDSTRKWFRKHTGHLADCSRSLQNES